jgi:hypothetical protein
MDLHDQWTYMQKTTQWRFTPPTHVVAAFRVALEFPGSPGALRETCRKMGLESVRRVTVVMTTGEVACDSALVDRVSIGDLSRHSEILEALAGREGHAVHQSRTLNRSFL